MIFRCDSCGRFISLESLIFNKAIRRLITPDSYYSKEEYETLCHKCKSTEGIVGEVRYIKGKEDERT